MEGYVDLDKQPDTGCEYKCRKTANDDTACNNLDDDCDGQSTRTAAVAPPWASGWFAA